MIKELEYKFELGKEKLSYRRIDSTHILDIYVGYNVNKQMSMIITEVGETKDIQSSKCIDVKIYEKFPNKVSISFNLMDNSMSKLFLQFCNDIIESSRDIDKTKAINFIIRRWERWITMFKKPYTDLLNESQVLGLLGELIYLKEYMIPKYGQSKAIDSWLGPDKSHKDFEIDDTWYEIKVIKPSSLTVKISSVEQLDSNLNGTLVTVILDKSNKQVDSYININKYCEELEFTITNFDDKLKFIQKLTQCGYYKNEEYDKYIYKFINKKEYAVDNNFPKLSKENLSDGIVKASYEISLDYIEKFLIKENNYGYSTI
ncbi:MULTISPECIES: PD-(D/E)XK motif protein [Romboutsia]|jgi:hypothetical protein|uniref:PD-(D/E)XK motif protein n=1 Tax=Romboutsia TaxID=1501226 RepID=UPI00216D85C0|nr:MULTISPECIES: PD-(D/E)XK motif protein [Romboutsia]MCI9061954.1 PD-(D/E)XK motif protein [Romboutsia sp.]